MSLKSGIYIDDWKMARVIPIYKSENRSKCENYRLISILPIISKVFITCCASFAVSDAVRVSQYHMLCEFSSIITCCASFAVSHAVRVS